MKNLLLMFSGGLDSTGALWKLITTERKHLYIHHMRLKNVENRFLAEDIAVKEIMEYAKSFLKIEYTESTHEYPRFQNRFLFDGDLSSFMAGNICASIRSIKHVAFGRTATDDLDTAAVDRVNNANGVFRVFCTAEKIYPVQSMFKKEIYEFLPLDLQKLTWSCRRPVYSDKTIVQCKKCKTCREMAQLGIPHRSIEIE